MHHRDEQPLSLYFVQKVIKHINQTNLCMILHMFKCNFVLIEKNYIAKTCETL